MVVRGAQTMDHTTEGRAFRIGAWLAVAAVTVGLVPTAAAQTCAEDVGIVGLDACTTDVQIIGSVNGWVVVAAEGWSCSETSGSGTPDVACEPDAGDACSGAQVTVRADGFGRVDALASCGGDAAPSTCTAGLSPFDNEPSTCTGPVGGPGALPARCALTGVVGTAVFDLQCRFA